MQLNKSIIKTFGNNFNENFQVKIEKILTKVNEKNFTPRIVMSNCYGISGKLNENYYFSDHKYLPFYYYLCKEFNPSSILSLNFELGIELSACLFACPKAKIYAQNNKIKFYNYRIGKGNIARTNKRKIDIYVGNIFDDEFKKQIDCKWDLILINNIENYDNILFYLNFSWEKLSENGIILISKIKNKQSKKSFEDFSLIVNRCGYYINIRNGYGIISKKP